MSNIRSGEREEEQKKGFASLVIIVPGISAIFSIYLALVIPVKRARLKPIVVLRHS